MERDKNCECSCEEVTKVETGVYNNNDLDLDVIDDENDEVQ